MGLYWDNVKGLVYQYKLFYGSIGLNITQDWDEVLHFLGIPRKAFPVDKNRYDLEDFAVFILSCKYSDLKYIFTTGAQSSKIPNFVLSIKKIIVRNIPHLLKVNSNITLHTIKDSPLQYINEIDVAFKRKGNFVKAIKSLEAHKLKTIRKFTRNKFNGNLIMMWVPELSPDEKIGKIMKEFKEYIEKELKAPFAEYSKTTALKDIRFDFISWYGEVYKKIMYPTNLPY